MFYAVGSKQRTHDIELLGVQAGEQNALLGDVLPKTDPNDRRLFDLLKKAYIDARYSMSYRITAEELAELQKRVLVLAERVRSACLEKIATFCGADAMRKDLPVPPSLGEPVLQNLPPPPTDPQEFGKWAQSLSELAEQRAEHRWQQGRTEGIQIGKAEGSAEGELRGEAKALLLVLRSRGLEVPVEVEMRITECSDAAVLASWLSRVATVGEAAELLAG